MNKRIYQAGHYHRQIKMRKGVKVKKHVAEGTPKEIGLEALGRLYMQAQELLVDQEEKVVKAKKRHAQKMRHKMVHHTGALKADGKVHKFHRGKYRRDYGRANRNLVKNLKAASAASGDAAAYTAFDNANMEQNRPSAATLGFQAVVKGMATRMARKKTQTNRAVNMTAAGLRNVASEANLRANRAAHPNANNVNEQD